ncbi:MAG: hypothetical protein UW41_C0014G0023 [Candidatus Collierbacteria bacterium GW2011_GWC2_44_18]|uniref:Thymidylate synthase/dCMP hydroxymethylase domain-containing protein n=1 Tax=Candidatus Collierbacteria bacterium GW2011_GWC2_44_18 TaxID=1618392 RepID=A0A0G1KLZ5_9BACT|nr:MAG: hypothetical protein UW41_C0014G0023 [Candidatus Collierbacteria bacterium GW2011_GWC2_44_18]
MKQIITKTAGLAWQTALKCVDEEGHKVKDGVKDLKEVMNVFLTVENPDQSDLILEKFADQAMVDWMRKNFLSLEPVANWGYSYGQRFTDYYGIDQIAGIVEKLKKNQESKSATITLMDPKGDVGHMPCIVALDFKIRDGKLMTTAFFRSQDVGKKIYADIICLGEISKKIADAVNTKNGELNILIVSLHLYEEDRDKFTPVLKS